MMLRMDYEIRKAVASDEAAIAALIRASARGLSRNDYNDDEIEAAISFVYGVDSELIIDGTYFVAEVGVELIGCGGWSRRKTLFGGDHANSRQVGELNPERDAAKIRAFFVHPNWARRGVGRAILGKCETEAQKARFRSLELMSTLPGLNFYRALGYEAVKEILYPAGSEVLKFVVMRKTVNYIPGSSAEGP
ncbi:MAG TPA: GNAT family N-acetyltransferase [Pyrinomonadaceae bacterium]|jgi:N-acetylglutamate synthase-like GNAT family acetyltransferase|nr:GNAT family N-acetyltransferase [Pyrinomonadaceae bacterium]